eukprot:TRINITY_DN2986_c0_g1_i1.p1 TRINITY_DN2986_c0_g1~~TRINITY_DN2986_c0_g1_i1.p1  ORF type:complete len:381 (+),score=92.48 TRINITY_DN2986_c0_g1_i1:58-1143(+)
MSAPADVASTPAPVAVATPTAASVVVAAPSKVAPGTRMSLKRTRVSKACSSCQKSHLSCDHGRPCARCIKKGTADTCVDGVQKKRGKKPRRWYLEQGLEPPAKKTRVPQTPAVNAGVATYPNIFPTASAEGGYYMQAADPSQMGPAMVNPYFFPPQYMYPPYMMGNITAPMQAAAPVNAYLNLNSTTPKSSPRNSLETTDDESVTGQKRLSADELGALDILSQLSANNSPNPSRPTSPTTAPAPGLNPFTGLRAPPQQQQQQPQQQQQFAGAASSFSFAPPNFYRSTDIFPAYGQGGAPLNPQQQQQPTRDVNMRDSSIPLTLPPAVSPSNPSSASSIATADFSKNFAESVKINKAPTAAD